MFLCRTRKIVWKLRRLCVTWVKVVVTVVSSIMLPIAWWWLTQPSAHSSCSLKAGGTHLKAGSQCSYLSVKPVIHYQGHRTLYDGDVSKSVKSSGILFYQTCIVTIITNSIWCLFLKTSLCTKKFPYIDARLEILLFNDSIDVVTQVKDTLDIIQYNSAINTAP